MHVTNIMASGHLTIPPHPRLLGGPKEGGSAMQPLHSRGSPNKRAKSELAPSSLPSRGPKRGRKCYATPAFSGVPNEGGKIISAYLTAALSETKKRAEVLRNPCILGCTKQRGQRQKWLPHHCLLKGPKEGGSATPSLHSRGSPTKAGKIRSGYFTPTFLEAPKMAEVLRNPCILRGPQQRGQRVTSGHLTRATLGAQKRAEMLRNPCILQGPQHRGQN